MMSWVKKQAEQKVGIFRRKMQILGRIPTDRNKFPTKSEGTEHFYFALECLQNGGFRPRIWYFLTKNSDKKIFFDNFPAIGLTTALLAFASTPIIINNTAGQHVTDTDRGH